MWVRGQKTPLARGKYQAATMLHAEIAALENALAEGHEISDIRKILISKGSCRRCAAILYLLDLEDLVGPRETSSSYSGAYVVPDGVFKALSRKLETHVSLNAFDSEDVRSVLCSGSWW